MTAVFAAAEKNVVWSSYRGSWQRLPIELNAWPWPWVIAFLLAIIFGPMAFFGGVMYLFLVGLGWLAARVVGLAVGAPWPASRSGGAPVRPGSPSSTAR